jgi:hypothetical protein
MIRTIIKWATSGNNIHLPAHYKKGCQAGTDFQHAFYHAALCGSSYILRSR